MSAVSNTVNSLNNINGNSGGSSINQNLLSTSTNNKDNNNHVIQGTRSSTGVTRRFNSATRN